MTPEVLHSLIAGAETLDVEFKGEEARGLLVRSGKERRGVHDEPARKQWAIARSGKRRSVSESTAPVCLRRPGTCLPPSGARQAGKSIRHGDPGTLYLPRTHPKTENNRRKE